jgi:2-polyprenyl-6-methoxyphenol hydroxylase-like FAD-dependent oxidoreductase
MAAIVSTDRPRTGDDRVIVVGAGPVGLVLTLKLIQSGVPVTLLEAIPRLGFSDQMANGVTRID